MEAEASKPSPSKLAQAIGISVPYASQLLNGDRKPPLSTALKVYRAIGVKLGPIESATEREIRVLERFQDRV